ncbi:MULTISPECIES: hypothetical protein [Microbacterium]|uniref:hypothetical protein n=1 Tax=Microbacterium TaxID=33882 RepID=UPI0002EDAD75|nr:MULTISPECIES: hypothetical protein [Microbacterium]AZH77741.1 hypothetical protein CSX12_04350 [Microbacterium sp. Y-01]MDX2400824.1 hypothetical protein [Microbacterium algeriense]
MSTDEWTALLDRLEEDARRVLAAAPGAAEIVDLAPWTPPSTPLPPGMVDRARAVIELQRSAMDRARGDLDDVRQHLGALTRIPGTRSADAPAYLDVDG